MMVLIHFLHSLYKEERNFSLRGIQSIFHQSTCQSYNAKIADFHETVLPGPTDLPSLVFCVASFPLSLSRYTYKHMYYICLYLYLSTERMYDILVLSRGPGSIYFPKNTFKYILLVNFQPTGASFTTDTSMIYIYFWAPLLSQDTDLYFKASVAQAQHIRK